MKGSENLEEYNASIRALILEYINKIESTKRLCQIYTICKRLFLSDCIERGPAAGKCSGAMYIKKGMHPL